MIKFTQEAAKEGGFHFSSVTFSISEDANLDDMCYTFDKFLRACGYNFDGEVTITDKEPIDE